MARKFCLALIVLLFVGVMAERSHSAVVSPRNPYRSFNISGVNYGSMQWEKSHRTGNPSYHRGGGRVWRRR